MNLRPNKFSGYTGQADLVARLQILIAGAKSRGEPMSHALLFGPPGLGKTTLANIIAAEMNAQVHIAMGPGLEKPSDVQAALCRLEPMDVLFIDEIHSVGKLASELLYPAMEDRTLNMVLNVGGHNRIVNIDLPPFTLVGATTQPGLIEAPLRDRFGIPLALEFYADDDLAKILTHNAGKLGLSFEHEAIRLLATRSRGTPRIANHLLAFARDYSAARHDGRLTVEAISGALAMQKIDDIGLNQQDRQYLRILVEVYKGGPVGIEAMAATMGLKSDTVGGVIEPFLLQRGLILRTQRGRKTTDAALAHLAA